MEGCNGKVSASGTVSEVGFAVGSGAWAESMRVAEECAGFFDASFDGLESPTKTFVRACDFASPAFFAASNPACRIAVVNGPSVVDDCGGRAEMVVDDGAFERLSAGWRDVEGVLGVDGVEIEGAGPAPTWSFSSPYSFHSSTSSRSYPFNISAFVNNQYIKPPPEDIRTPTTIPILTRPGSFLFPARRPQSMRAFSSVATSRARKGILFALRMVSRREVAVMMCDEPAVREV